MRRSRRRARNLRLKDLAKKAAAAAVPEQMPEQDASGMIILGILLIISGILSRRGKSRRAQKEIQWKKDSGEES